MVHFLIITPLRLYDKMEKKIIGAIITVVYVITGGIFTMIILWNIISEDFLWNVKIYGWDHFYIFLIIMAVVFFSIAVIL